MVGGVSPAVCSSVRLSVACLDLTREQKGLEIPKLAVIHEPIRRSKGQRSRSQGHTVQNHCC